eukprot:PhM_4_TR9158/c0_g1_i1/m.38643
MPSFKKRVAAKGVGGFATVGMAFDHLVDEVHAVPGLVSSEVMREIGAVMYVTEIVAKKDDDDDTEDSVVVRMERFRPLHRNLKHIVDVLFVAPESKYLSVGPMGRLILGSFEEEAEQDEK